jgi:hypothetical protein
VTKAVRGEFADAPIIMITTSEGDVEIQRARGGSRYPPFRYVFQHLRRVIFGSLFPSRFLVHPGLLLTYRIVVSRQVPSSGSEKASYIVMWVLLRPGIMSP